YLFKYFSRNDNSLNLIRTFVNLHNFCISKIFLYWVLTDKSITSKNLHSISCYLHSGIRGKTFCKGSMLDRWGSRLYILNSLMNKESCRFDIHSHISKHELNRL